MFSGIVQTKSEGHESSKTDSGIKLKITSNESFYLNIKKGDSVSVDGVCLTVTDFGKNYASFDVIPETIRCTNLNEMNENRIFNLERSLKFGDEVGGHLVSGHVHETGTVEEVITGDEYILRISFSKNLSKYLFKKGYVAINGASLTIKDKQERHLTVALIPETLQATNLNNLSKGDKVNLEADQQIVATVDSTSS
jgi:riboflavin synthase